MKRVTPLFAAGTLIVGLVVYYLIMSNTPLSMGQTIGTGVAFLAGWLGLVYAGSEAIEAMIRRRARLASAARAPERGMAFTRRFNHDLAVKDRAERDVSGSRAPDISKSATVSAAAERASGRAEVVARRFNKNSAVPELPLQRLPNSEEK